jgi:hypothetical protein
MRLASVEPDPRYSNLDRINYVCDCGHSSDGMIARKD